MTLSEIGAHEKKSRKNVKICISPRKTLEKADILLKIVSKWFKMKLVRLNMSP